MGVDLAGFRRALRGAKVVGLDTSALIYHLEGIAPYAALTTDLLAGTASGSPELVLSVISLSEILVGPWQRGLGDQAARIRAALESMPGLRFADVTAPVAVDAAALRARTGLPLPDALIIASVAHRNARVVVTNDRAWSTKPLPCAVCLLDDYVRPRLRRPR